MYTNIFELYKTRLFYINTCLFVGLFAAGIFTGVNQRNYIAFVISEETFLSIFWHNLQVGLMIIVFGLLTAGLYSYFLLAMNGYITGVNIGISYNYYGLAKVLKGVLPHFFPEIFALIFCSIIGSLTFYLLIYLYREGKFDRKNLSRVWDMILVVILLFLGAAFLESQISAHFREW